MSMMRSVGIILLAKKRQNPYNQPYIKQNGA